jgi:hypothetical protein
MRKEVSNVLTRGVVGSGSQNTAAAAAAVSWLSGETVAAQFKTLFREAKEDMSIAYFVDIWIVNVYTDFQWMV